MNPNDDPETLGWRDGEEMVAKNGGCMAYIPTYTINLGQIEVDIPYMKSIWVWGEMLIGGLGWWCTMPANLCMKGLSLGDTWGYTQNSKLLATNFNFQKTILTDHCGMK